MSLIEKLLIRPTLVVGSALNCF